MQENQEGWLPTRAALHPTGLYLALRQVAPAELRDAFMQETVTRVPAAERFVQIARGDVGKAAEVTAPMGLIFHVARCGSTLISQLLKQRDGIAVYAEPLPVNEILLPPHKWPRAEIVGALRSLGDAFARHAQKPYVLKFSSWNTLYCDIVAEAFPDSPWILSMRDPVEIGVSLLAQTPGWLGDPAGPAAHLGKLADAGGDSRSSEEFVARLYGAFCDAMGRLDAKRGRLVPYDALPAAAWEIVAPHFALAIDNRTRDRMITAAGVNSKSPVGRSLAFSGDAAAKQAAASTGLRRAVDSFARPQLERLLNLHAG